MATVAGLFGSGLSEQELSNQLLNQRANDFAQLTQDQRLTQMGYKAGNQLGGGIAGAFGVDVQDPMLKKVSTITEMAKQFDTTSADGLRQMAQAMRNVDPDLAMKIVQQADKLELSGANIDLERAKIAKEKSQTSKLEEDSKREASLREALSTLPEGASDKDIRKALMKFGSADKLLTLLQSSSDKEAQREQQAQLARERLDNNLQLARERGATQQQIAQMQLEGRQALAALKAEKPATVDDKAATRIGQNIIFDKLNKDGESLLVDIDKNKDAFTLTGRGVAAPKSVTSPDDPGVKARSDVDSYLNKARNAYLLAAKGTQTEGDAQRAWKEFSSSLDFSSATGAKRSVDRIRNELLTQKQANEAYLKSRNVAVPQAAQPTANKTVVRTGTYNGRKVVEYSDGSVDYAN